MAIALPSWSLCFVGEFPVGREHSANGSTPPPLALLWFATLNGTLHHEQIIKGLLLAGSLIVVYGESNSGKTFWVLDLALSLAAGIPWRGRRTRRGLVVYVAGEGAASVRARVAAYRKANPGASAGLPFAIVPQAVSFLSPESVEQLIATVRAAETDCGEKVVLLIVDTFARGIPGGDENSAGDVGIAVAAADRIRRDTAACVAFVHHAGKDPTKGARGSSALRAATDTEILIEGQSGQRTATVTKQRDLETGDPMPFELVPVEVGSDPDDGQPITSCVVRQSEHQPQAATGRASAYELRGKAQRQFIGAMRLRSQAEPERIWGLTDLRHVARESGMSKGTARSVVDAVVASPYMQATAFGYRFTDGRTQG